MPIIAESLNRPRAVEAFLRAKAVDAGVCPLAIDSRDQMYAHSLADCKGNVEKTLLAYYKTGLNIYDTVGQIVRWHFGSLRNIECFLDFACGYGRFTRFLLQDLPPRRIWSSDIHGAAVEFHRQHFGVNGVISVVDPSAFPSEPPFDCILASSFFTHAPEATFASWLRRLYDLLRPGGLLIFSVHDMSLLPPEPRPEGASLFFKPGSYDSELPAGEFGATYVEEMHLRSILTSMGVGSASVRRIKAGLDFFQDVYVVTNRQDGWTAEPDFAYLPFGHLHKCAISKDGEVLLEGCATDHFNHAGQMESVQLAVDGRVIRRCLPERDWPEIAEYFNDPAALRSGWSMTVNRSELAADDIAVLTARNSRGREYLFYCGTLNTSFDSDA